MPSVGEPRLTNIRYAHDLLLFAQSFHEAVKMLEETSRGGYNAGRYAEPDLDQ